MARIRAQHYDVLKPLIRDGDILYVACMRGHTDRTYKIGQDDEPASRSSAPRAGEGRSWPETVWNEEKYQSAIDILNAVHDPRVRKSVVLSSVEDLKTNLPRLPKDLVWVEYDMEGGMTPGEEMTHMVDSVKEFAAVAHKAGLKASWATISNNLEKRGDELFALAKDLDNITLQHQKVLQYQGLETFIDLARQRSAAVRKVNPACGVGVQVVVGRGSNDLLEQAVKAVLPDVSVYCIWTMKEPQKEAEILKAVRGE
ncbi:MAG: hypothetical protein NTW86_01795 [Candidatus Sumerlaeota bacterium]|nr:hypothetical protein [Candidatus Sumerlaeota bacterium]